MNPAEAKFVESLLPKLVMLRTVDGQPFAIAHVNELPPWLGEHLARTLTEREAVPAPRPAT